MPVVDASVLVSLLVDGEDGWAGTQVLRARTGSALWAPHLVDAEVGHALRGLVAARETSEEDATAALRDLTSLPLRRIVHTGLLDRAWELRHNLSFYDGLYVALAELLDEPLLTLDGRMGRAIAKVSRIEVLTAVQ
jgi:predicted nucleic acid-binding protein